MSNLSDFYGGKAPHTITEHSDITDATGANLEELTGGGATTLHSHASSGHYMLSVWAEENAALGNATYEWAFGNGANTATGKGIVIHVPSGETCTIIAMGLSIGSGTATVECEVNGSVKGLSDGVEVAVSTGTNNIESGFTPYELSDGDVLNFRTRLASGTAASCQVVAYLKYTY